MNSKYIIKITDSNSKENSYTNFNVLNNPYTFLLMFSWCSVTLWRWLRQIEKHRSYDILCVKIYNFNSTAFVAFIVWIVINARTCITLRRTHICQTYILFSSCRGKLLGYILSEFGFILSHSGQLLFSNNPAVRCYKYPQITQVH